MGMMAWISSEKGLKTEMGRMVCASATIRQPQLVPTYSFLSRMVSEATWQNGTLLLIRLQGDPSER